MGVTVASAATVITSDRGTSRKQWTGVCKRNGADRCNDHFKAVAHLSSLADYFKNAAYSWRGLVHSPKPDGKIAILSTIWSPHAKQSGYHHVASGLGMVLPSNTSGSCPPGFPA